MWAPAPTKATLAAVPRVVGPRPPPFQSASCARKEPTVAAPKAVHPPPTWLTRFEDYEEELLAEFRPSSMTQYPRNSTLPATVRVEPDSSRALEPLGITPLLGLLDSNPVDPDNNIGDEARCSEEDEDLDEWDADYHQFEFDADSDFESDYGSFGSGSGSSTPASCCWADAFDWPSPYQGHASAATPLESPPQGSPSVTSSDSHAPCFNSPDLGTSQPSSPLQWSTSTDPLSRAVIMTPPLQAPVVGSADDAVDDSFIKAAVDRLISMVEEGEEFGSGLASEKTRDSYGGDEEGWGDWLDLADYTFPAPP